MKKTALGYKKGIVLVTRDMLTELAKKLERQARENKKLA